MPNTPPEYRPTRYKQLGYFNWGPRHWQFMALDGFAPVGKIYPTKAELLADIDRYAKFYGCD